MAVATSMWQDGRHTNDPWGDPVNLGPVVNSAYSEQYLSLSPDGLLLLFSDRHAATTHLGPVGMGVLTCGWQGGRAFLTPGKRR